ncbi:uncharacterized protein LOC107470831 [Arachis duranensis]|uniref:Uncharacterized protein LOC107470831 n=1 Tax=Arachis duranensis TaxID=130453 RepID=A0A6P4BYH0_ARADU|nr:uncharacterized protein LOC107470831 [Arachis duranensis]
MARQCGYGATYQRLMNKIFQQQIGRNIEVYVDDMVAKTKLGDSHIQDLAEIFGQIRRYNMRLNPEKCAFGVQGGKFLGFILTSRGIEANPEKCQAILTMQSPSTVKEVQRLTGRLAALSRFLPCLAPKSSNFFQCLKKKAKHFEWNQDCEMAFQNLKEFLSKPPVLQKPKSGEPLYIYLSITDTAISSALVTETDRNQQPVYFVSKSLQNAELRYPRLEKLALALVFSSRRLRPYFQSHTIIVRTGQPLRQVLSKPELAGRLIKWAIELSEFDIQYQPRGSVKSQYLVDFVAELTEPCSDTSIPTWTLFVDGASNPQGAGAGILLENSDGIVLEHSLRFSFKASNNQSEYEALIAGLRLATDLRIDNLRVYCDSLLVVQQSTLDKPSIDTHNVLNIVDNDNWQQPYIQYLRSGTIPSHIDNKGQTPNLFCPKHTKEFVEYTLELEACHRKSSEPGSTGRRYGKIANTRSEHVIIVSGIRRPFIYRQSIFIIQRFGIPSNITTDNGRQFIDQSFKAFLQNLKIKQHFSYVEHPQSNGLAEAANKVILQALRKKLDNAKGLWAELVPEESPFRLVYGSEAMIPIEVSHGSMRTIAKEHDQARQADLDLIEEIRETAAIRHRALQQQLSRRYGQKVKPRSFNTGDLVLRKTEQARRPPSHGKLAATWEGPYKISEVLGRGAYKLEDISGTKLPNTWNVGSLKRYYS